MNGNVTGKAIEDISSIAVDKIGTILIILKAAGVLFLIYVVYLIVNFIMAVRRSRRIKRIEEKVSEIDSKLDRITQIANPKRVPKKNRKKH